MGQDCAVTRGHAGRRAIRSDDIGLGPYTDNHWSLTVRDGKIVSAKQQIAYETNGFSKQAWEPFARWVSIYHPDDVLTMYVDDDKSMQQFTEDSNRLWEQRSIEYVTVVKQDSAAHLAEPKVAAYVAKLDSICAAAQTRAKDEIRAIPRQNKRRSARRGITLCARQFPRYERLLRLGPFTGPMRDGRSRLWRSCSTNIRTWRNHRKNGCLARSSRSRASTSASFLSDLAPLTRRTPRTPREVRRFSN